MMEEEGIDELSQLILDTIEYYDKGLDGKFLNIDEAVKKPLISALNYISWNKDKNTREINRQKSLRNEL